MTAVRRLRARVRALDPFRFDVGLAAIGVLGVGLEAVLANPHDHSPAITFAAGVAVTVPIAWRRRAPLPVVAVFAAIFVGQSFLDSFLTNDTATPVIEMILLLYTVGRYGSRRAAWTGAALVYGAFFAARALQDYFVSDDLVWMVIIFLPPVVAGRAMRGRVLLQRELREKAEHEEAGRSRRARDAVESERNRIAAELQAVVANGVSAMVVQAEGVPRVLQAGDTARAGEALALIEETGRDALAEMRRLLGVLRRDGHRPALAPQPSLSRARALVESATAGLPVELRVEGEAFSLSPGVDLAAYRVLQEALGSATAAGGVSRVEVTIRYDEREVTLSVADDRTEGDGPDRSTLLAMRERVGLYDGSLRAGPSGERGFRVTARLPRAAVVA